MPPAGVSWLPTFQAPSSTISAAGLTIASMSVPVMASRASQQSTSSVSGWPLLQESVAAASAPAVVCRGEGVLPVPERVEKKLLNLEFVEMKELLPESWLVEEEETCRFTQSLPKRRSGPVTDILQWLQCFGTMVGVLSQKFPMMVPDLMAYQSTIIKCSRDFDGLAWAQYDRAYRRQAAQTKDLRWSRINTTLYSLCFAGKARRSVACVHCLSDGHRSDACPDNPASTCVPMLMMSGLSQAAPVVPGRTGQRLVCHLYNSRNGPRCTYNPCKFAHICEGCRGNHPRSACPKGQGPSGDLGPNGRHGGTFKRQRQF